MEWGWLRPYSSVLLRPGKNGAVVELLCILAVLIAMFRRATRPRASAPGDGEGFARDARTP